MLSEMNISQKQSVTKTEGSLLVVAGAGTGKTQVLISRIAYLITEKEVEPQHILAITFTNKAGLEMKERIKKIIGNQGNKVWISTFHSFCHRVLREYIHLLGYEANFEIIDEAKQRTWIKKVIEDSLLDIKDWKVQEIITQINHLKEQLPKDVIKPVDNKDESIIYQVYEKYKNSLFKNNQVDFSDLIYLTLSLFNQYPDVLNSYQNNFKYIHIDEYQDTNHIQHKLIKLLVGTSNRLFAVGDTDQCIYSWRGANIQNILSFEKDYPNTSVILLEQNYRSNQAILNVANDIIQNNKERWDKKLWTLCGEGKKVEYFRAIDDEVEASFISQKILSLCSTTSTYNYGDVAILCRTTSQFRAIETMLIKEGITYQKNGSYGFFKRKEIKDVMAYLGLICFGEDNLSFERIINVPKRGIGVATFNKLAQLAIVSNRSLMEVIDHSESIFSKAIQRKLVSFKQLIQSLQEQIEDYSMSDFIQLLLEKTAYFEVIESENQMRLIHVEKFKTMAEQFEKKGLENLLILEQQEDLLNDLTQLEKWMLFMNELVLQSENQQEVEQSKVRLLTLHASKGLEFPIVFLTGMEEGILPLYSAMNKVGGIEEERRLAYVGITRAKELLYLTSVNQRLWKNHMITTFESRFIEEINANHLIKHG